MKTYNKRSVFLAAFIGIFLFGVSIITLGSTLPHLSATFHLDEIQKGTLASVFPFGILTGSLIFGPIVDRYSYKYLLSVSVLLEAIGFLFIAYAGSFYQLNIAFYFIGLGGGAINGATSSMVSDLSEDFGENKGANLSLLGVFFGLGSLGMPVLLGGLESWFQYDQIIAGLGFFMFIPTLYMLLIPYPAPKQAQGLSTTDLGILLKDSLLLLSGSILFFQSGWEAMLNNWTTTYLIGEKGLLEKTSLYYLTIFVIAFTTGRLLLGILLRRLSPYLMIYISSLTALLGGILLFITQVPFLIIFSLILIGLGLAAGFPIILGLIGNRYTKLSGTAFGIAFTIALLGNMIINYLIGVFTKGYGMNAYPVIMIATGAMTTLLLLLILRKYSKK
jgi:FHS family glucose/mannose:H+ symporter-like MFS transporter